MFCVSRRHYGSVSSHLLCLCMYCTDNVACPKWRALSSHPSPRTDGSVVKMAVAVPHLRGDSRRGRSQEQSMTKLGNVIPRLRAGCFSSTPLQWNGLAKISLPSPMRVTLTALPTQAQAEEKLHCLHEGCQSHGRCTCFRKCRHNGECFRCTDKVGLLLNGGSHVA